MVKRKKEDKQEPFCSYLQNQIRQSAVKEVIENPERYKNFVTDDLMSTFQVYHGRENGQITPKYRQPQTHLVSASK